MTGVQTCALPIYDAGVTKTQANEALDSFVEAVTVTSASVPSPVTESSATINDVTTTFVDNANDQISCSLDNPDGCLMCGS